MGLIKENLYRIKKLYISRKKRINLYFEKRKELNAIINKLPKNKSTVILIFTPTHTNLGDHAIALAEFELLKKNHIDYVEITYKELMLLRELKKLGVLNKRTILFSGGGYLGTLWLSCELLSREIVSANPKSRIVFFPNTIFYENNKDGQHELLNSVKIYNRHNNLTFFAREKTSYYFMKEKYNDVRLCPDMVFSLDKQMPETIREGCLLCLRNDLEKTLNDKDKKDIIEQVEHSFNKNYHFTDMHSEMIFDICERSKVLDEKYNEFRSSKIVITDRLHGMIFSAITATPCIVIDSKSPKIKGCYEWIKDLNYIRFCDDYSKISNIINELMVLDKPKYKNELYSSWYDNLLDTIRT